LLAESLEMPFVDLDNEIVSVNGRTIPQIINGEGENVFRDMESNALKGVLSGEAKVIALGGGALLRKGNRSLAEAIGQIIFLDTDISVLVERLSRDEVQRPLLAEELDAKLSALLEGRRDHYASFALRVDGSQAPEQVSWNIQRLLGRYHLRSMGTGYDVLTQENGIDHIGEMLKVRDLHGPILVVSDTNVGPLYGERVLESLRAAEYTASQLIIPAGEVHKNLETVNSLWRGCLEAGLDRKSTVIALGGGVVGDMAGFAAATFMRSCNWVVVPTTLLSMVDASVGGKTGFDLPEGKNLVGAFHPPRLVLADPEVLSTLPERELRAGLAEVVKHGVIADPELFDLCAGGWSAVISRLPEVVRRGIAVKVKIIEEDPYEKGFRAALNLGHTIGHAVEFVSGFNLLHGEAVSIGMVAEARLAERISVADQGTSDAIAGALSELGLPIEIPVNLAREKLIQSMKVDKKKSAGIVRFALPVRIGEVRVGVEIESLEDVL